MADLAQDFHGKRALVTGGASGIGAATAELIHRRGATVVIADVDASRGEALAARLGGRAVFAALDVTDEGAWLRLEEELGAEGGLQVLVHSAGIAYKASIEHTSLGDFRRILDVNLVGTFLALRAASRLVTAGGAVALLSSVRGVLATAELGAYGASKFGVRALGRVAALEFAERGIRVNSVCPGSIVTPIQAAPGFQDDDMDAYVNSIPLRRRGTPREVAEAIAYLVGDQSGYVTGSEFIIDGGMAAGRTTPKVQR